MPFRDPRAWQVAADPVAYHHRWRHCQANLAGNARSAINAALAAGLALDAPASDERLGAAGWRLIEGWPHLCLAAELLAVAKQPRCAQAHRDYVRMPLLHQRFMHLGFSPHPQPGNIPMGRPALRAWGGGYLVAGLAPVLPTWLAQRLLLPFDTLTYVAGAGPEAFDHSCFWSALSHAQTATPATRH